MLYMFYNDHIDGTLQIEGERAASHQSDNANQMVTQERSFGCFKKRVKLPKDVIKDAESMSASYENGVLIVEIPKSKESKRQPQQISIK